MVLKKPYAFLIKHFKLIHLLLTLLLVGIAYKLVDVVTFFNNYVKNGYRTSGVTEFLSDEYLPFILYLMIFVAIIALVTLNILMVHKKKPAKLYTFGIIYYVLVMIGMMIVGGVLDSFREGPLVAKTARSLRDIILLGYLPQVIFIIGTGIRAIGFNIKKFDFQNDIQEMGLNATDAQEFEVKLNIDFDVIKRKIKRIFRELVYYVKENKFIVLTITGIVAGIFGYIIYSRSSLSYNHNYKMGMQVYSENVAFTFNEAVTTNLDYKGEKISEDSYYVVINTNAINKNNHSKRYDYNSIKLEIGGEQFKPDMGIPYRFIDIGPNNAPTSFQPNKDYNFILVYKIPTKLKSKSKKISIYTGTYYKKGEAYDAHSYVSINAPIYDNPTIKDNYDVNQVIKFNDTFLKETTLKITKYEITDKYFYTYEQCKEDNCKTYQDMIVPSIRNNRHTNKLLIAQVEYDVDGKSPFVKSGGSIYNFVDKFVTVEYKVDDEIYKDKAIHVTPLNANGFIAFEVPSDISEASIIQLKISIRNKIYYVNLKLD